MVCAQRRGNTYSRERRERPACRDVEDVNTVVVRYALAATDNEDLASYEIV